MSVELVQGANTVLPTDPGPMTLVFRWRLLDARGPATEPVAAAIVCGPDGQALTPDHLVFFNELAAPSGAVRYEADDDAERIEIDLAAVPPEVASVVFLVYVNPDPRRPGSMTAVRSLSLAVVGPRGTEVARFAAGRTDDPGIHALILGEVYRNRDWWKFRAVGQGFARGVDDVVRAYGLRPRTP